MKIFNKLFLVVVLWLTTSFYGISQPIVSIQALSGCIGNEMNVPIEVHDFNDIAALTLYIKVDTSKISFLGLQEINENLFSGELLSNLVVNENTTIILVWYGSSAANIQSGILCNLRIKLKSMPTNFIFSENCELVNSDLTIITDVVYNDGNIVGLNSFYPEPDTANIEEGQPCSFSLPDISNLNYQWQIMNDDGWLDIIDNNIFSGSQTFKLIVDSASTSLSNSKFRCLLFNEYCNYHTDESLLIVNPLDVKYNLIGEPKILTIYPNPCNDVINCSVTKNIHKATVKLRNMQGIVLLQSEILTNTPTFSLNLSELNNGIYFLFLYENNSLIEKQKVVKQL